MPLLLRNLILEPGEPEENLRRQLLVRFSLGPSRLLSLRVLRRGIDARKKPRVKLVYTVEFSLEREDEFLREHAADPDLSAAPLAEQPVFPRVRTERRVVVAGSGPAGLFAVRRLLEYGISATLLERGGELEERVRSVQRFWGSGILDTECNVQFGEGGAGTFSDGKLTTRVRDPRLDYILGELVRFGAPADIRVAAKPHIGTDLLRGVVSSLRRFLEREGVRVLFRSRLSDLLLRNGAVAAAVVNGSDELPCDALVIAPGHSARDTYAMLQERGVALEKKPFAIGVRVEHPQELINRIQFGHARHPHLPAADYALAYNGPDGRSAYSFCMCPGGVVVASTSEEGCVATNGMSLHRRNSPWANSALVATVTPADFGKGALAGVEFQRVWERKAFSAGGGGYVAPAQNLLSFLGQGSAALRSSYRPGVRECDLSATLPPYVVATLREGIRFFDRRMRGFVTAEATLTGVETRTSAPLRIVRGEDFQSVSVKGLYPAGEGAGYAGGIVSAALDGIRAADALAAAISSEGA